MCWSGEASSVLAAAGLLSTVYAAYQKEPAPLWMALGYFSLMEMLQAFTYSVIDRCGLPSNQIATMLGYLHIAFQPFFINAVSLYFIDPRVARKVAAPVYAVCFFCAMFMLLQVYPFSWAGTCLIGQALCGKTLCSLHGNWHIAWSIPFNNLVAKMLGLANAPRGLAFPSYVIAGFITPLIYGSWRFTLYHFMVGVVLTNMTTNNPNERPAVWCLLSIGLLLLVLKTRLRRWLRVRKWFFWNATGSKSSFP